jgi:hypothetical protein
VSYTLDKLLQDLWDATSLPSGKDVFVQVGDSYYLMRGQPTTKGGYVVLQAVEVPVPAELTEEDNS